jgi:hypothetical protein
VSKELREQRARQHVHEALYALLSDDHNEERGLASLRDVVDRVLREEGSAGLVEFAVALSVGLAGALERIATDRGLVAADLADVWFAE